MMEENEGGMKPIACSEYLDEVQIREAKEDFLRVQTLDDAFVLLEKIHSYVLSNASSDEKYDALHSCLISIKRVADNPDLEKMSALAFLSPTLGIAMVGMMVLVGVFSEEELRVAFAEKASIFQNGNANRDA